MQVKHGSKVEHSDNSHDDQVFSYLMALYVWYEGKNLAENYGIRKTSIKTDTDEEIEEVNFEDSIEKTGSVKLDNKVFDEEDKNGVLEDLEWVERDAANFVTSKDLKEKQYFENIENRNKYYAAHREEGGLNQVKLGFPDTNNRTDLPVDLFSMSIDDYPDTDYSDDEYGDGTNKYSVIQGNLSDYYTKL
jgi:hypothetical protein